MEDLACFDAAVGKSTLHGLAGPGRRHTLFRRVEGLGSFRPRGRQSQKHCDANKSRRSRIVPRFPSILTNVLLVATLQAINSLAASYGALAAPEPS